MNIENNNKTSIFDIPNVENLDIKRTYEFVRENENLKEFKKNHPEIIKEIWDIWKNLKFEDFKK